MKITLIHSDYDIPEHLKDLAMPGLPLGVGYIAACLERDGHEVVVVDAHAEGLSREKTIDRIRTAKPDITGISCVTSGVNFARDVAKGIRPFSGQIVMGGIHPTFCPESVLDVCDVVVRGEGEETFPELISSSDLKEVKGISYQENGGIVHNPSRPLIEDLNTIPWPARHLFKLELPRYKLFRRLPFGTMLSGRGCPMGCIFCQNGEIYNVYRSRNVVDVVDEIEMLITKYDVHYIAFVDEDGLIDKDRMRAMCEEILRRKLKFYWGVDARVDRVNDLQLLKLMSRAGCGFFFHGVESANPETLANMKKGISPTTTEHAFKLAQKAGIRSVASTILAFPGEQRHSAEATVEFLKRINASYAFFGLATPFPGSKFAKLCEQNDWIKVQNWDQYTVMNPILEWGDFSLEEQREMLDAAHQSFYGRPTYWLRRLLFELPRLDWRTLRAFAGWSWETFQNTRNW